MDLIPPFDLKLFDKNIIKQINSINTEFLCIGTFSSCGGHYPANRPNVLITYIGKDFKNENGDRLKEKLKTVRGNLEFNPPLLTLIFLDEREFKRLLENLHKFTFKNYNKIIKCLRAEVDREKVTQTILNKIKKENDNPKILICWFKFEKDGLCVDDIKIAEYIITFTCIYQFLPIEKNLSIKEKDAILKKIGTFFIETIHDFLKSNLFDFKPLIGELRVDQIKDCNCYRLEQLCGTIKEEYLNRETILLKNKLKMRNEVVFNLLPKTLRDRGILLKNGKLIYRSHLIPDIIKEIDRILNEFYC